MPRPPGPESDLPPPLQKLVVNVVRRTNLWLREKRDVRAELASHFREGLGYLAQEGTTGDAAVAILTERFGNARVAARLIRRSKKRSRPMIWKVFIAIWRGFVCTLI